MTCEWQWRDSTGTTEPCPYDSTANTVDRMGHSRRACTGHAVALNANPWYYVTVTFDKVVGND